MFIKKQIGKKEMKFGVCSKCKNIKFLTKHSVIGSHIPPYNYICRLCHDKEHGVKGNYSRRNQKGTDGKYVKGTKKQHKKGWKKKK